MNKLEQALVADIANHYPCNRCGAVHYPLAWMPKTREKMLKAGKIERVVCSFTMPWNVALRIKESVC